MKDKGADPVDNIYRFALLYTNYLDFNGKDGSLIRVLPGLELFSENTIIETVKMVFLPDILRLFSGLTIFSDDCEKLSQIVVKQGFSPSDIDGKTGEISETVAFIDGQGSGIREKLKLILKRSKLWLDLLKLFQEPRPDIYCGEELAISLNIDAPHQEKNSYIVDFGQLSSLITLFREIGTEIFVKWGILGFQPLKDSIFQGFIREYKKQSEMGIINDEEKILPGLRLLGLFARKSRMEICFDDYIQLKLPPKKDENSDDKNGEKPFLAWRKYEGLERAEAQIFSHMAFIAGPLHEVKNNISFALAFLEENEEKQCAQELMLAAENLRFCGEYLDLIRPLNIKKVNLRKMIQGEINKLSKKMNASFDLALQENIVAYSNNSLLAIFFANIFRNAVQYSRGDTVYIRLWEKGESWHILVENNVFSGEEDATSSNKNGNFPAISKNGKTLDSFSSENDKVRDSFFAGRGWGLKISRHISQLLGGEFDFILKGQRAILRADFPKKEPDKNGPVNKAEAPEAPVYIYPVSQGLWVEYLLEKLDKEEILALEGRLLPLWEIHKIIFFDGGNICFIDSAAIAFLVKMNKIAKKVGGKFQLVDLSEQVMGILRTCHLDGLLYG